MPIFDAETERDADAPLGARRLKLAFKRSAEEVLMLRADAIREGDDLHPKATTVDEHSTDVRRVSYLGGRDLGRPRPDPPEGLENLLFFRLLTTVLHPLS